VIDAHMKSKSKQEIYVLDYLRYYQYLLGHISISEDIFEEMNYGKKQIKKKAKENLQLNFKINKLYTIPGTKKKIFEVCSINPVKTKISSWNTGNEELTEEEEEVNNVTNLYLYQEGSQTTSVSKSSSVNEFISLRDKKQSSSLNKNSLMLKKLTISAMIFSVILVLFCIIFMIEGLLNSNKLKESYDVFMSFSDLERKFYHTNTNLFDNLRIETTNGLNSVEKYYSDLHKNPNITITIREYINKELLYKLTTIQDKMKSFQNLFLNSYFKDRSDLIYNSELKIYRISIIGNEIKVETDKLNIFESIKLLINKVKIILESNELDHTIKLITFIDEVADFGNLFKSGAKIGGKKNKNFKLYYLYKIILL